MDTPLTVQDILLLFAAKSPKVEGKLWYGEENLQGATNLLYQAMQEVIGASEKLPELPPGLGMTADPFMQQRNKLRAEQRTRLNKLFGRGE